MTFTQIRYAVADGIATITLDRPDKLNAFIATMMAELMPRSMPPMPMTPCAP